MNNELYEMMMVNTGKQKSQIWDNVATKFIDEIYMKDFEVYGKDTKELYGIFFPDNELLFEAIEDVAFGLNEDFNSDIAKKEGQNVLPYHLRMKGPAGKDLADIYSSKGKNPSFSMKKQGESGIPQNLLKQLNDRAAKMGDKPGFIAKVKSFFTGASSLFSKGIAGVIANPWPLLAVGIGATAIVALIRKFKKLSDDKKKKALDLLDKSGKNKVESMLAKDESELKKELEKKEKK
jgi:hypothetical protein